MRGGSGEGYPSEIPIQLPAAPKEKACSIYPAYSVRCVACSLLGKRIAPKEMRKRSERGGGWLKLGPSI